ncbi:MULTISPECIES: hypothetical protein [Paenibacillus]|jgi:hypothetical protein|uniref:Sporulation membrane protein YtrI C-terminal domain-containing protein n=2 Tax=Paenibacillus TaxID=44249 RepID=A0ABW3DFA7_9BACL|nr:hypothetical protein [Aneurinibacillus sp. XH2]
MRVPNFDRYRHWLARFGLFLAGVIIGAALFMGIYQQNFSLLASRNADLEQEIRELRNEIETYSKNRKQAAYIGGIFVHLEEGHTLDDLSKVELEKRVHEDLKVLSGKPVADFKKDPKLYMKLIEKPYPGIYDKDYRVEVTTLMLVQSELRVWFRAKPLARN